MIEARWVVNPRRFVGFRAMGVEYMNNSYIQTISGNL